MANEKRLRLLALTASGNPVTLAGSGLSAQNQGYSDTATLNAVPTYADGTSLSIGSDQYLPVTIDPGTAIAEEAWITTTPSGSPVTCTIIRGTGSSTGAPAHSTGALVVAGPTPYDKLLSYDDPWAGNLGYDYEFQGDTTSLPSYSFNGNTYTWQSYGSPVNYAEHWGRGSLQFPAHSGIAWGGVYLPIPTQSSFTVTAKIYTASGNAGWNSGLFLTDGTKLLQFGVNYASNVLLNYYTTSTTYSSNPASFASIAAAFWYLQIIKNSSTSWTFQYSNDGINYIPVSSALNVPGSYLTPSGVGFAGDQESTSWPLSVSCQFFRVR